MGGIRRLARGAWRWAGHLSRVQWILSVGGAGLLGILTWVEGQPLWLIALVGLGAFALCLIIQDYVRRIGTRPQVRRDTPLSEALAYALTGEWGRRFDEVVTSNGVSDGGVWRQARQRAHDESITIWGRQSRQSQSGVYEKVPADFWIDHQPEWFSLLKGEANTEATTHDASGRYVDLMVSRAEFEKEWPRKRPWNWRRVAKIPRD